MIFLSPLKKLSKTQSKKQIKNSLFLSILISIMLIFSSCENIFSGRENSPAGNSGDKTYLTISLGKLKNTRTRASASGRTVYPLGISVSQLKNFKLTGAFENGEEQELFTAEDSSGFANKSLEILPGNWAFTLTASFFDSATSNDIVYSDSINYEIRRGIKNLISFELKPQLSGNGGFKITVNLPGDNKLDKVRATLTSLSGSVIETKDLEITAPTNPDDPVSVSYSKANITDENGGLEPGSYHLLFEFLAAKVANPSASADDWILVNQWESYVCIIAQKISTANLNLNFNTLYTISYNNADGGPITDFYEGLAITKFSPGSAFLLPRPKINGKVFLGWKRQDTGEDISEIKATDRTDFTLVAQTAEPVLYVSGTGYDNIEPDEHGNFGDGSEEHPFESIDKSCEKIIELGNPDVNWTIYIDGDVTGPHEGTRKAGSRNYSSDYGPSSISADVTLSHAKSILLIGKNSLDTNNLPQDQITRGLSRSTTSSSSTGTALIINSSVPITIKNLKISKSNTHSGSDNFLGGALRIENDATVSLSDGAWFYDNYARNGGGVYNEGTLYIYGTAIIGELNNTKIADGYSTTNNSANFADYGGAIYNKGNLYIGYTNYVSEADNTPAEWSGEIRFNYSTYGGAIYNAKDANAIMRTGKLSWNATGSSGSGGGAVYNLGNYVMTGDAIIENNKSIDKNGGGVYNGSTSTTEYGTFTFSGGKIRANCTSADHSQTGYGGGVYNKGIMYVYGEAVIGDESKASGTSIPDSNTNCSNFAAGYGGGICVAGPGKLYLGYENYTSESENQPASWTGGIYYNYSANTSYTGGGGLAIISDATVIMNSGTIANNNSLKPGCDVYCGSYGFTLFGTSVISGEIYQYSTYTINIADSLSHLANGAFTLTPESNPEKTEYYNNRPVIKLTDTATEQGITLADVIPKFSITPLVTSSNGRTTNWIIDETTGKVKIATSAGFSASLDTGTADIVVFRNGYSFTPPIVESASSTSTITLDVKKIAGKDFDKSTMTLVWTFDGEELNRASMPEAVSFRYSDSDRQIDINSGMLAKGTYDVSVEATYNNEHYSFTTQIIKN